MSGESNGIGGTTTTIFAIYECSTLKFHPPFGFERFPPSIGNVHEIGSR
jgi:hypothetical protein